MKVKKGDSISWHDDTSAFRAVVVKTDINLGCCVQLCKGENIYKWIDHKDVEAIIPNDKRF